MMPKSYKANSVLKSGGNFKLGKLPWLTTFVFTSRIKNSLSVGKKSFSENVTTYCTIFQLGLFISLFCFSSNMHWLWLFWNKKSMLKSHISYVVELSKMEGTFQFSVNCQSFVYLAYWFKVNYYLKTWNQLKWLVSAWRYWFSTDLKVQIQITKWPGDIQHDVHLVQ